MAKARISGTFDRCVKSVRKTVKARKGSNKESAAIAICTKSVLHKRGRTLKRYRRGRLTTQKKFRGGLNIPGVVSGKTAPVSKLQEVQRGFRDIQASRMAEVKKAEAELKQELSGDGSMADYAAKDLQKAKELAGLNKISYAPAKRDSRLFGDKY